MFIDWPILLLGAVIVFAAFYVASIAGFGSSALTVSFLALLFDIKLVVPVLVILSFIFNLVLIGKNYQSAKWSTLLPMIVGALIGAFLGVQFFTHIDSQSLVKILGIVIIVSAWDIAIKKNWGELPFKKLTGVLAGTAAGISEIMFSVSNPPVVFYLTNFIKDKQALRSTIISFFTISSMITVSTLFIGQVVSWEVLEMSALFTPPAIAGTWLGHHTSLKINEKIYRIVISGTLIFSGLMLIFN